MMRAEEIWAAHQRKRFMRPDASRYLRPQPHRPPRPAGADISEARSLMESERRDLSLAKALVAELRFYLALRRFDRKYRPDQPRDDHGRWVDDPAGDQDPGDDQAATDHAATDFSDAKRLPRIPDKRPPTSSDRTAIAKEVAGWLKQNTDAIASAVVPVTSWLRESLPNIISYFDAPKSLEELQQDASDPQPGYNIHHIVEQSSARADGYPASKIDSSENLVRIPTMKHWNINAWYQTPTEQFGGETPRDYLRHKDWDERERVGLEALRLHGVLK